MLLYGVCCLTHFLLIHSTLPLDNFASVTDKDACGSWLGEMQEIQLDLSLPRQSIDDPPNDDKSFIMHKVPIPPGPVYDMSCIRSLIA